MPRIAMVNYLNSVPFGYGFNGYKGFDVEILLAHPAECARLYQTDHCDIALVPVGALDSVGPYEIISDYCIGCDGEVRTVCLFSNQPIAECHTIHLDHHSRTSALLCRMVVENFLHLTLRYKQQDLQHFELPENEAVLMIGDKVFDHEHEYAYKIDLGTAWKEWQGLPFTFAVWIAKPHVSADDIAHLNRAIALGMSHIGEIAKADPAHAEYFSKHISYFYSDGKRKALDLFLKMKHDLEHSSEIRR